MTHPGDDGLLVLNLGSATLKAARFSRGDNAQFTRSAQRIEIALKVAPDSPEALLSRATAMLGSVGPPACVAHRVVHGGDATSARLLDQSEVGRLTALAPLAPLHQPPALAMIAAASALWPDTVQWGVFDTAWHAGLPANARRLPVPAAWEALGVRRYGFHGLAFASAMRLLRAAVGDAAQRVVLAHLGGGASLCAVLDGRSVDTTMAMTPLEGLPMATRSGSLDPGALLFLLRNAGHTVDSLEQALYRECGLRGLSGVSGDVRELLASSSPSAQLALDVFALRIAQGIAGMATHLGGIDDLVFSGGIGSHAPVVRAKVVEYLAWLGLVLDNAANAGNATRLSPPDAKPRVWCFVVNEEDEIAAECAVHAASLPTGNVGVVSPESPAKPQ